SSHSNSGFQEYRRKEVVFVSSESSRSHRPCLNLDPATIRSRRCRARRSKAARSRGDPSEDGQQRRRGFRSPIVYSEKISTLPSSFDPETASLNGLIPRGWHYLVPRPRRRTRSAWNRAALVRRWAADTSLANTDTTPSCTALPPSRRCSRPASYSA